MRTLGDRAVPVEARRGEAGLAARWAEGVRGPRRIEDGRALRVVFPGVAGGGGGPDFRGAILDAGGDLLRGDVEIHLRASGWRAHRHHVDPAYGGVVLHVVEENDTGAATTLHASGRAIAVLVLARHARGDGYPPPFTPPCALATARGADAWPVLERLGLRRLRMKAARAGPVIAAAGPGQGLYALLLETLGGPANRPAFAALARRLSLAALLERAEVRREETDPEGNGERTAATAGGRAGVPGEGVHVARARLVSAELQGAAADLVLKRAGLRPMAAPGRRLDIAGALIHRLWPEGAEPGWPRLLAKDVDWQNLRVEGLGRGLLVETWVNACLPVALASSAWAEEEVEAAWKGLPSPGTYGRLGALEGWLASGGRRPFGTAARLQGGLLLHGEYCTRGMCGNCPLS